MARAFVEQQHVFVKLKVSKTGKSCITFRNFVLRVYLLCYQFTFRVTSLYFVLPDYILCYQFTFCVTSLHFVLPVYILCYQFTFVLPVYILCYQFTFVLPVYILCYQFTFCVTSLYIFFEEEEETLITNTVKNLVAAVTWSSWCDLSGFCLGLDSSQDDELKPNFSFFFS